MEDIGERLDSGVCKHCGNEIMLIKWSLSKHPVWEHNMPAETGGGLQREYCPGQYRAEPA